MNKITNMLLINIAYSALFMPFLLHGASSSNSLVESKVEAQQQKIESSPALPKMINLYKLQKFTRKTRPSFFTDDDERVVNFEKGPIEGSGWLVYHDGKRFFCPAFDERERFLDQTQEYKDADAVLNKLHYLFITDDKRYACTKLSSDDKRSLSVIFYKLDAKGDLLFTEGVEGHLIRVAAKTYMQDPKTVEWGNEKQNEYHLAE